jgi:thiol:disulfide interchange protein DsbD
VYLAPPLFSTTVDGKKERLRPPGVVYAWVESFLLPDSTEHWSGDLKGALAKARESGKPVFVDFTGETCTNCKLNEQNVFTRPEIRELFAKYETVQLYTDKVPLEVYPPGEREKVAGTDRQKEDAAAHLDLQKNKFNTEELPYYVVLRPMDNGKIKVVGVYAKGTIKDPGEFAQFLRRSLDEST